MKEYSHLKLDGDTIYMDEVYMGSLVLNDNEQDIYFDPAGDIVYTADDLITIAQIVNDNNKKDDEVINEATQEA